MIASDVIPAVPFSTPMPTSYSSAMDPSSATIVHTAAVAAATKLKIWPFSPETRPFVPIASDVVTAKRKSKIYAMLVHRRAYFVWTAMKP